MDVITWTTFYLQVRIQSVNGKTKFDMNQSDKEWNQNVSVKKLMNWQLVQRKWKTNGYLVSSSQDYIAILVNCHQLKDDQTKQVNLNFCIHNALTGMRWL